MNGRTHKYRKEHQGIFDQTTNPIPKTKPNNAPTPLCIALEATCKPPVAEELLAVTVAMTVVVDEAMILVGRLGEAGGEVVCEDVVAP